MANKYVYCIWNETEDGQYGTREFDSLFDAQERVRFEHKYGVWAGEYEFGIRRRLRTPAWEEIS